MSSERGTATARSADPDTSVGQPLHVDIERLDANGYWVCNTIWVFDGKTEG
jgi:hypothetical protein